MPNREVDPDPTIPDILQQCIQALDDKKAEDIRVLYVGEVSSITDYFVIATGTSNPHLKALSRAVESVLDEASEPSTRTNSRDESGWVVVDAYSFMVHLFAKETRTYYNLEGLWKDGVEVPLDALLTAEIRQ
jgi:ribosome-associated protein